MPTEYPRLPYPQTRTSARAWFVRHGIAKSKWASHHKISRLIVEDLLRGRLKGLRGEAHRAAVLLGLKQDPMISENNNAPLEKQA